MPKITYRQDAFLAVCSVVADSGRSFAFARGETKDVSDADFASLMTNVSFVDEHGRNDNFACAGCDAETREIAVLLPHGAVSLRVDGDLLCRACHPETARRAAADTPDAPAVAAPSTALVALEPARDAGHGERGHDVLT